MLPRKTDFASALAAAAVLRRLITLLCNTVRNAVTKPGGSTRPRPPALQLPLGGGRYGWEAPTGDQPIRVVDARTPCSGQRTSSTPASGSGPRGEAAGDVRGEVSGTPSGVRRVQGEPRPRRDRRAAVRPLRWQGACDAPLRGRATDGGRRRLALLSLSEGADGRLTPSLAAAGVAR